MPPKPGKKRSRESTGTATTTPASPAAGAASGAAAVPPGSAPPALRRPRSNSAASQEEGDGGSGGGGDGSGDASRAVKRSRRSGDAKPVTDSAGIDDEDVDMGDAGGVAAGQAGANGGGRGAAATAPAPAAAVAKKGSGRRKSTSVAAANGESAAAASQPASKRGRKSTPSSSSSGAPPPSSSSSAPAHRAPTANGGGANAVPTGAATPGGRPPLATAPASRTTPAGARGGAGGGRGHHGPVVPAATANGGGGGSSASGSRNSFGAAVAAEQAKVRAQAEARAGAAVEARARAQKQQQLAPPSRAASSPVPAARLRRVTGPQATNGGSGDDDESGGDGSGGNSRGGGMSTKEGGGVEESLAGRGWRAVISRGKGAWEVVCRKCNGDSSAEVEISFASSGAPPVTKKWTLKCLVLVAYLVLARGIWAGTLWATAGIVGSRSTSSDGGGGTGGVPRRQVASSIVRQSKDFRSLEGVLAERRRYLKEMEDQDEVEHKKLESLRVFVQRLDEQVELLRNQAAGGVASRGAPDDPDASEVVSLSQLEEVKAMQDNLASQREATSNAVEEGEKWTRAAEEEFEALASASHSSSSHQLSPQEKAESDRDAEHTWNTEFNTPLEEAFLALEEVHNTVDAMNGLAAAKPGSKESSAFVRVVEEAKGSDAVGESGGLQERVEAIAVREVTEKWASGEPGSTTGQGGEGIAGSQELLKDGQEAEKLVAHEIEIFSSGGTGMPDHASLGLGGSVVYGPLAQAEEGKSDNNAEADVEEKQLTSPTLASSTLPWADYLLHVLRVPGRVFAEGADAALSSANSLGSCFAFLGGEGTLTVKLARPPLSAAALGSSASSSGGNGGGVDRDGFIRVTHVSIEHARTASAPTAQKSAPRSFRVLGWNADPGGASSTASSLLNGITSGLASAGGGKVEKATGKEDAAEKAEQPRPFVLLDGVQYEAGGGARGVQTFAVPEGVRETTPPVGWVTLEVRSNHGGKWTCLYGFRVHGDRVE